MTQARYYDLLVAGMVAVLLCSNLIGTYLGIARNVAADS